MHDHAPGLQPRSWLEALFQVFTPRRVCMFGEPDVIWMHVVSDALIALAYFSIPFALVHFARRRPDLVFGRTFRLFAAFIFACGTTHVFGVWDVWQPLYRVEGFVKAWTAAVSIATAAYLWREMPRALTLPSPAQLRTVNESLQREIDDRRTAQEALRQLNESLEARVVERTAELEEVNERLREENEQRRRAESEKQRLLDAEQEARAAAERASRAKDEFLAILSHELRTPLNAVLGWTAIARKDAASSASPKLTRALDIVEKNAILQTQIVSDLLDVSAIVANSMRVEQVDVDVREILQSAIEAMRPEATRKGVLLELDAPEALARVRGDRGRLLQVFSNLLSNGLKFTPAGGRVSVVARAAAEDMVEVAVGDTGIGIAPELIPLVFDRFWQADSSVTRSHGGLGLAIMRAMVEAHEGRVRAESEGAGRGARFVVELPRSHGSQPASVADASEPVTLAGARLLVVDDDDDGRELLQRVLRDVGAHVTAAESAARARPLLEAERFDVVVCDLSMPGESGLELLSWLRSGEGPNARTRAIALTALAGEEDRSRALEAGFDTHLPKPATAGQITTAVASLRAQRGPSSS